MRTISTPDAPIARGHYSQAIVHEGIVYVAGQLPIDPAEPERKLEAFDAQARQVIANIAAILQAAGSDLGHVLKAPVYVLELEHEHHKGDLLRIRALTNDLTPPADACTTWRALYAGLAEMERELMEHIHLENNILFRRALAV